MEHSHGRWRWSVWMAFSLGLSLTALALIYAKHDLAVQQHRELALVGARIEAKIDTRFRAHAQVLLDGAAFFASSDVVTRSEWREFIARSQVGRNLPGIQGVGFVAVIPPEQLAAHLALIRAEGFPDYRVWPEGQRALYTSILYLEPLAGRNLRAFGYDMLTEPVRRAAMERAQDEDLAVLSGKVKLVQETDHDVQPGALMYVPVYRPGLPVANVAQRRAALVGWVYSRS